MHKNIGYKSSKIITINNGVDIEVLKINQLKDSFGNNMQLMKPVFYSLWLQDGAQKII